MGADPSRSKLGSYFSAYAEGSKDSEGKMVTMSGRHPSSPKDDRSSSEQSKHRSSASLPSSHTQKDLMERTKSLEESLARDPHDVHEWLSLVHHQELLVSGGVALEDIPRRKRARLTRTVREIQISVYERALSHNPKSPSLLWSYLECGREVWGSQEVRERWERLLSGQQGLNGLRMWARYLSFCQTDWNSFTVQGVLDAYSRCVSWYTEKCAGRAEEEEELQAEVTYFPVHAIGANDRDILRVLEETWEDESCPVFGEKESLGWCYMMEEEEGGGEDGMSSRARKERKDRVERSLGTFHASSGRKKPSDREFFYSPMDMEGWVRKEEHMDHLFSLPLRGAQEDEETSEDPYRTVLFEDISPFLFFIRSSRGRLALARAMWAFCDLDVVTLDEVQRYDPMAQDVYLNELLDPIISEPSGRVGEPTKKKGIRSPWSYLASKVTLAMALGPGLGSVLPHGVSPLKGHRALEAFTRRALSLMVEGGRIEAIVALETVVVAASLDPAFAYALACRATMAFPENARLYLARFLLGLHLGLESEVRRGLYSVPAHSTFHVHHGLMRAVAEWCVKKEEPEICRRVCVIWASCLDHGSSPSPLNPDQLEQVIVCAQKALGFEVEKLHVSHVSSMEILRARRALALHLPVLLEKGGGDVGVLTSILEFSIGGLEGIRASEIWGRALADGASARDWSEEVVVSWVWMASLELERHSRNGEGFRPKTMWEVLEVALHTFPRHPLLLEAYHQSGVSFMSYRLDCYLLRDCQVREDRPGSVVEDDRQLEWSDRTLFYAMTLWMDLAYPATRSSAPSLEKAVEWVEWALDAQGGNHSPVLWILQARLHAMQYQAHNARKRREIAYSSLFEAIRAVPWCKDVYMLAFTVDFKEIVDPGAVKEIERLMMEKGLRLRLSFP
ncbi:NRDE-2, necessary for RNA interference-domain-containing protein [Piptocephalis cylindrospora]|uniref:NRDE-2, necessary for RNA interference-domain-containing protein n=1 Tax=Piptocephalis cylindrospora TaxID=1907219 RepID=A0A4V1IYC2_9FUNG|nr:NRDE-2, necessary for RNA interference-domain-containing protein [Piptocephalis cylindrospora]|eukprot:RKP14049.1 NRDE-2, necessary for RNA interference-domain-containing protein [Piptocephalis cylindrospora]